MSDLKYVPVRVTMPEDWIDIKGSATQLAQLERSLAAYANGLWRECGLEATSQVTVILATSGDGGDSHWMPVLTVNSLPARLALPDRIELPLSTAAWTRRLARALYANHALVVPTATSANGETPSLTLSLAQPPPAALDSFLADVQQRVFERLGLYVPRIRVTHKPDLERETFQIAVNGRSLPATVGDIDVALAVMEDEIVDHAPQLLTTSTVQAMLDLLSQEYGALVDVVRKRALTATLYDVLCGLLAEEISIGDLPTILEGLVAVNNTTVQDVSQSIVFTPATGVTAYTAREDVAALDTETVLATVRTFLKMQISRHYTPLNEKMYCLLLDPAIERSLQSKDVAAYTASDGGVLHQTIWDELWIVGREDVVLLTTIEVRRTLWELIHVEFPQLPVLCYQELSPDLSLEPLGRIAL